MELDRGKEREAGEKERETKTGIIMMCGEDTKLMMMMVMVIVTIV